MRYLHITEDFANQNEGYHIETNYFGYAITSDGRYVCTAQSKVEFPVIFEGTDFEVIDLQPNDFPQSIEFPE